MPTLVLLKSASLVPDTALELLNALRAEHYALLGVVDGKRPADDDSSEPTANSTKRRAVDPFGNVVRIGDSPTPAPTPMPTPAAAKGQPLARSPTPPTPKRTASPPGAHGSPTPPAAPKRAFCSHSPTVFSAAISLARPAAPAARRKEAACIDVNAFERSGEREREAANCSRWPNIRIRTVV